MNVGVLASGGGTNLQALLDSVHRHEVQIVAMASDRADAPALGRADAAGVLTGVFERSAYADRATRDSAIADWFESRGVQLVVLAGYLSLLDAGFIARFRDAILNVHPTLLPAFPGVGTTAIAEALAYGVKVHGVTIHLVDEGMDTGPIVLQRAIELPDAEDVAQVLASLRPLEHALLPEAVRLFARGAIRRDPASARRLVVG